MLPGSGKAYFLAGKSRLYPGIPCEELSAIPDIFQDDSYRYGEFFRVLRQSTG